MPRSRFLALQEMNPNKIKKIQIGFLFQQTLTRLRATEYF